MLLKHLLRRWEADFTICGNGREVLTSLDEDEDYDLILMDIQMPVMDGITAMKIIRSQYPKYTHVPVIAFTADTFAENAPELASCHFNDFVTKPFKADELIRVIARHLAFSNAARPIPVS